MKRNDLIYVAGHRGMVGSAICRKLATAGHQRVIGKTRNELDLRDPLAANQFFKQHRPAYVFMAAAVVGGIGANIAEPARFIRDNILIQSNIIHAAHEYGAKKLCMLGSGCIYPRDAAQPISETALMTGELEPTNAPYAIAKIAGIQMAMSYTQQYGMPTISVIPPNLYGPHDNFDPNTSHVIPALIRKFHKNPHGQVSIWGTGAPRREFMYVDDLADACYFLMQDYNLPEPINVGTGEDVSITELAETIRAISGSKASIVYDGNYPDGMPRRLLDSQRCKDLGWQSSISLDRGLQYTWQWYLSNQ